MAIITAKSAATVVTFMLIPTLPLPYHCLTIALLLPYHCLTIALHIVDAALSHDPFADFGKALDGDTEDGSADECEEGCEDDLNGGGEGAKQSLCTDAE